MSEYDRAAFYLIAELRGGIPTHCDFCGEAYRDDRWPVPEEAGAWSCSWCEALDD